MADSSISAASAPFLIAIALLAAIGFWTVRSRLTAAEPSKDVDSPTMAPVEDADSLAGPETAWLIPADEVDAWEDFFDAELLRAWAESVVRCLQSTEDFNGWGLAGTNILLEHDDPGDACMMLRRAAQHAGLGFARIPAEAVMENVDGLRALFSAHSPVLVMLDWGSWSWGEDEVSLAFARRVRKQLEQFEPSKPILFALCAESADLTCSELLKVRAFDRVFSIQSPTPQFVGERFLRYLGSGIADSSLSSIPAKTGLVLRTLHDDVDGQRLAALQLRRRAHREARLLGIGDLTELTIRGSREATQLRKRSSGGFSRRRTAYHEAGHACVAVIASGGANIPDYASIVPAKDFEGIVRESLSYHEAQDDFTFEHLLLRVRILLSGRAGEEICSGALQISSGATSDLAVATRMTYRHFAHSGFHAGMERGENSAAFLAVLPRHEAPDPLQAGRVHREVRRFLANQYAYAMNALQEHRPFVDAVAERLMWDPVVDQAEMTVLARQFGLAK